MKPKSLLGMKSARTAAIALVAALAFAGCKSTEAEPVPEPEPEVQPAEKSEQVDGGDLGGDSVDHSADNSQMVEDVEAAREAALAAGAEKYYPDLLATTNTGWSEVKRGVLKTPSADHAAELEDYLARYRSLEKASRAQALKEKAAAMSGEDLDASAQKAGEDALMKYDELGADGGSGKDLLAQAELAYNSYTALLGKGLMAQAGRERKAALAEKKNADSVKASVAKKTKDRYKSAAETFKNADTAYSLRRVDEAYDGYRSSKETFAELFEIVRKDREEAQARLEAAKARVAASASAASEADGTAPLASRVSGIEDENAVLLEQDAFANPEDSVIDVESGAAAEAAEKMADGAIADEESSGRGAGGSSGPADDPEPEVLDEEDDGDPLVDAK